MYEDGCHLESPHLFSAELDESGHYSGRSHSILHLDIWTIGSAVCEEFGSPSACGKNNFIRRQDSPFIVIQTSELHTSTIPVTIEYQGFNISLDVLDTILDCSFN